MLTHLQPHLQQRFFVFVDFSSHDKGVSDKQVLWSGSEWKTKLALHQTHFSNMLCFLLEKEAA